MATITAIAFEAAEIPADQRPAGTLLKFRVMANGIAVPRTLRATRAQAEELAELLRTCPTCRAQYVDGAGGPDHRGGITCRSGSLASGGDRPHCSCDACF